MICRRHFVGLLPAAMFVSCSGDASAGKPRFPKVPWRVMSTTHFAADMVRVIGGEAVQSQCLLKPSVSPHAFVPSGLELAKFRTSDMVMLNGLGLEDRWPEDFADLAKSRVKVCTLTAGIAENRILRPAGPGGPPDPHVWMHPELAVFMVNAVAAALKEVMPKLDDYFTPRAHRLRVELEDAHRSTGRKMKELKPDDLFLLTSHDTMQYFAAAHGLEARALTTADGQIPAKIPSTLQEWIKAHKVKSLFRESFTNVLPLRELMGDRGVNPDHVIYTLALPAPGTIEVVAFKNYDVSGAAAALGYDSDIVQSTLQVD